MSRGSNDRRGDRDEGALAKTRKAMGPDGMVKLENRYIGPARRGAKKVGFGLGKGAAWLAMIFGFFNALAGVLFMGLATGFIDSLGVVFFVIGVLSVVFGGGLLWMIGRASDASDEREIEGHLRRMMTHEGSCTAREASRILGIEVSEIERAARELERRGQLERDVDTESGTEIYRPLGWAGSADDPLRDPELHSERRELESFEERLASEPGQAPSPAAATATAATDQDRESESEVDSGAEVGAGVGRQ